MFDCYMTYFVYFTDLHVCLPTFRYRLVLYKFHNNLMCSVPNIEICNVCDVTSVTDFDCIYFLEVTVNQGFLFIKLYQMN